MALGPESEEAFKEGSKVLLECIKDFFSTIAENVAKQTAENNK